MRTTLAAMVALVLLAGCGGGDEPEASPSTSPTSASASPSATSTPEDDGVDVDITLTADGPTPRGERVEVKVGQTVRLNVKAEVAGEIHVHSDPERTIEVGAGSDTTSELTIDRPGQVAVESHETDDVIVQLVVRP